MNLGDLGSMGFFRVWDILVLAFFHNLVCSGKVISHAKVSRCAGSKPQAGMWDGWPSHVEPWGIAGRDLLID